MVDNADYPALVHNNDPVTQGLQLCQVRTEQNDGFLPLPHLQYLLVNKFHGSNINTPGRLV